jgi:hypothetical protein
MALELRNVLSKAVEHTLPATLTFDHPSVAALVDHLATIGETASLVAAQRAEAAATNGSDAPTFSDSLSTLTEDDIARELFARLERFSAEDVS